MKGLGGVGSAEKRLLVLPRCCRAVSGVATLTCDPDCSLRCETRELRFNDRHISRRPSMRPTTLSVADKDKAVCCALVANGASSDLRATVKRENRRCRDGYSNCLDMRCGKETTTSGRVHLRLLAPQGQSTIHPFRLDLRSMPRLWKAVPVCSH